MSNIQDENNHAGAQSRAEGANLTDVLAAAENATHALFEMEKLMVRGSGARATIYEARCNVNFVKQEIKDEIEAANGTELTGAL